MPTARPVPSAVVWLVPRSLRGRIVGIFVLASAVVLIGAFVLLNAIVSRQLDQSVTSSLRNRLDILAAAVHDGDSQTVRQDRFAQLLDSRGRIVLTSRLTEPGVGESPGMPIRVLTAAELRKAFQRPLLLDRQEPLLGPDARLATSVVGGKVLVVGDSRDSVLDAQQRLVRVFVTAAPLVLSALSVAGWLLAGAALRPVADLTAEASRISTDQSERRLTEPAGDDEIARLARTLNAMLSRLTTAVRREREFIDDASHELRTPIAVARGELELALQDPADTANVTASLSSALTELDRLSQLAEDLLVMARERAGALTPPLEPLALLPFARAEAHRLGRLVNAITYTTGRDVVVLADPALLARVLVNLVRNADAAGARHVEIHCGRSRNAGLLTVADDGPGFPPGMEASAFERFSRGDPARTRGTTGAGLGLAIVAAISRAHHGNAVAHNGGRLGGAEVQVTLPLA
jgi:two-component system OmpR family sensor kinase